MTITTGRAPLITPAPDRRPRALSAFSCSDGGGHGLQQAGFHVTSVDIRTWEGCRGDVVIQGDAVEYILEHGHEFDVILATPPCQNEIAITAGNRARPGWTDTHKDLLSPTRAALAVVREHRPIPTVIECSNSKNLRRDLLLCGEMFGLSVLRHRGFEIDGASIAQPPHPKHRGYVRGWRHGVWRDGPYVAAYGKGGGKATVVEMQESMGIDWTDDHEALREALPPAYTQFIGSRLLGQVLVARTSKES